MNRRSILALAAPLLALAGCALEPPAVRVPVQPVTAPTEVQILAINDFHGNLEPPGISVESDRGPVPVGGAAYLATALAENRTGNSITVAAGDLIGASPLVSSMFYDEPTIEALGRAGLQVASVGNHEFDRGWNELKRIQAGGCRPRQAGEIRISCPLSTAFQGAPFRYLAANVITPDGQTLFPASEIRTVGGVPIGFIGMTLEATGTLVTPKGVEGLRFLDEADTANALVAPLLAQGAKAIVLLVHEGGAITGNYDDQSCPGLSGDVMSIVERLDPNIRTVISGHTHQAYLCRLPVTGGGSRLLTSAGRYGGLISDIRLTFASDGTLSGQSAGFVEVQGEAITTPGKEVAINPNFRRFAADSEIAALIRRYDSVAAPIANRTIGRLDFDVAHRTPEMLSPAAMFIADAMLFAARAPGKGSADFALTNIGGARAGLTKGPVSYGDLFRMQPFENSLVTRTFSGAEVKAILEQVFDSGSNSAAKPNFLLPSANFRYAYDRSRPAGQRIAWVRLNGKPLDPRREYRVAINNFLSAGGDNFTLLRNGRNIVDGGLDLDATTAYIESRRMTEPEVRVVDLTPKDWTPA